jgi:hypothetical protein
MALVYRAALSLLVGISVLTEVAVAQTFTPSSQALAHLENEFHDFLKDVLTSLKAMPDKASVYYMCVENVSRNAERLSEGLSHYKFSVAITDGIRDDLDKQRAREILKIQTELVQGELRVVRERINSVMGTCSRFPLAVAKGTELLRIVRKAEDVVGSIAKRP